MARERDTDSVDMDQQKRSEDIVPMVSDVLARKSGMFENHIRIIQEFCIANNLMIIFRPVNSAGRGLSEDGKSVSPKGMELKGKSDSYGCIPVHQKYSKLHDDPERAAAYTHKNIQKLKEDDKAYHGHVSGESPLSPRRLSSLTVEVPRLDSQGRQLYGVTDAQGTPVFVSGKAVLVFKDDGNRYCHHETEVLYDLGTDMQVEPINDVGYRDFGASDMEGAGKKAVPDYDMLTVGMLKPHDFVEGAVGTIIDVYQKNQGVELSLEDCPESEFQGFATDDVHAIATALREDPELEQDTDGFVSHGCEARNPNPEKLEGFHMCFAPDGTVELAEGKLGVEQFVNKCEEMLVGSSEDVKMYCPTHSSWELERDSQGQGSQLSELSREGTLSDLEFDDTTSVSDSTEYEFQRSRTPSPLNEMFNVVSNGISQFFQNTSFTCAVSPCCFLEAFKRGSIDVDLKSMNLAVVEERKFQNMVDENRENSVSGLLRM